MEDRIIYVDDRILKALIAGLEEQAKHGSNAMNWFREQTMMAANLTNSLDPVGQGLEADGIRVFMDGGRLYIKKPIGEPHH